MEAEEAASAESRAALFGPAPARKAPAAAAVAAPFTRKESPSPPPLDPEEAERAALFAAAPRGGEVVERETFGGSDAGEGTAAPDMAGLLASFGGSLGGDEDAMNFDSIDEDLQRFQEDEVVRGALEQGVDLRDYSRQVSTDLQALSKESIGDYDAQASKVWELCDKLGQCDSVLVDMQDMLHDFQFHIGKISSEIKQLQDDSMVMSVKLRNRRAGEARLHAFLQSVAVPEEMVRTLCNAPLDAKFVESVVSLNSKIAFLRTNVPPSRSSSATAARAGAVAAAVAAGEDPDVAAAAAVAADLSWLAVAPCKTKAAEDTAPQIEKLRLKVVTRIREGMLERFQQLRSANTNIQLIQTSSLLKFHPCIAFLAEHAPSLALEVQQHYVAVMSRTLYLLYRKYHADLKVRLRKQRAGKNDTIAVEERALKSILSSRVGFKDGDTLSIGDRENTIECVFDPPVIAHHAEASEATYHYEVIFRSMLAHLCNVAHFEYRFLYNFFGAERAGAVFNEVFARTLADQLEGLETFLASDFDAITLLIMIRLVARHRARLRDRQAFTGLDSFLGRQHTLLWTRLDNITSLNLVSMRRARIKKLGKIDTGAHYVTRRLGKLVSSYARVALSCDEGRGGSSSSDADAAAAAAAAAGGEGGSAATKESDGASPSSDSAAASKKSLSLSVGEKERRADTKRIVSAVDDMLAVAKQLLGKLALQHREPKEQAVFLINNYDMLTALFEEVGIHSSPCFERQFQQLKQLHEEQVDVFVECELRTSYGNLIDFVKGQAASPAAAGDGPITLDANVVTGLVAHFAAHWKADLQKFDSDVLTFFSNFRNGMEVLKKVLTQLLLYYTRLQELIQRANLPPDVVRGIVSIATIMHEIKQHSRSFD